MLDSVGGSENTMMPTHPKNSNSQDLKPWSLTARSTSRITTFVLGSTLACSLYVQGGPVQVPTPVPTSLKATQLSVDAQGKVVAKTTPYEGRDAAEQFGHLKN